MTNTIWPKAEITTAWPFTDAAGRFQDLLQVTAATWKSGEHKAMRPGQWAACPASPGAFGALGITPPPEGAGALRARGTMAHFQTWPQALLSWRKEKASSSPGGSVFQQSPPPISSPHGQSSRPQA